ncbi:hypothetical protein LRP88_05977 [Fusarium phalaenopsidis]
MSQNNNGIMTLGADKVDKKKEFIDAIVKDPYQATEEILGPVYDHAYFQRMSIYSWETIVLGDYGVFRHWSVPTSMPFDAHLTVLGFDAVMY